MGEILSRAMPLYFALLTLLNCSRSVYGDARWRRRQGRWRRRQGSWRARRPRGVKGQWRGEETEEGGQRQKREKGLE